jgi:hypothetical protein
MEGLKAAPPVVVTGAHVVFGLSLADWVAVCTLIYIVAQMILMIPKYKAAFREYFRKSKKCKECTEESKDAAKGEVKDGH